MRKLVTIQRIAEVCPIEGADMIEKVRVNDWWCVTKKDEFKKDDLCVYFEIDSLLPVKNPIFSFLGKGSKPKQMNIDGKKYTGYRLRTVKLRGQISQGLVLSLKILENTKCEMANIGDDVSRYLNVVKYEDPIPACLAGKVKGFFPGFLKKTDEERVQNLGEVIKKHNELLTRFYITEKLDGTSVTFFKKNGVFGVCSRNLELLETEGNTQWRLARELDLENKLPDNFAIQGELVGEGIQGNPLKISGQKVYFFNVFNIKEREFLNFEEMKKFLFEMGNLLIVPVINHDFVLDNSVDHLIKMADGESKLCDTAKREGLVFRPLVEMKENIGGTISRFSFKVVSNQYLLEEKE